MTFLKISGLLLLLLVAANLWWRWLSRRRLMPCPTLFAGILENGWVSELSHAAYLGKELTKA